MPTFTALSNRGAPIAMLAAPGKPAAEQYARRPFCADSPRRTSPVVRAAD